MLRRTLGMIDELLDGYRHFHRHTWPERRDLFQSFRTAQAPRALVVACSDSRVDPQLILGRAPGEIFVVRNVANLVPPFHPDTAYHGTSAALEFAVRALEVKVAIVLGHSGCGGVGYLLDGAGSSPNVGDFVAPWMQIAAGARARALAYGPQVPQRQRRCEQECIRESIGNLYTFPWVRERVDDGRLSLHGMWFELDTGCLHHLGVDGTFQPVPVPDEPPAI